MAMTNAMRGTRRIAAILLLGLLPACYDRIYVQPSELRHLDGYDIHNERLVHFAGGRGSYSVLETDRPYRVVTAGGDAVDFNSRTELSLHLRDGRAIGGRYLSIAVDDATFQAQIPEGALRVPLSEIVTVETRRPSPGKTLGLVAGVGAGIALTVLGVTLGVVLTHQPSYRNSTSTSGP